MVNDFLPSIRGAVAHELRARSYSQSRIAAMLGITQARVSHYLSITRSVLESDLREKFDLGTSQVQEYATVLADDISRSQVDGIFTLYSIWKNLLFSGAICAIHQKEYAVSKDCAICMQLHRPQVREGKDSTDLGDTSTLQDLSNGAKLLEDSHAFSSIMPEVSVNVAVCKTNPKTSFDVAAFPGRINRIHGRARALIPPEFGCSNHMARVLMIFNRKDPSIRAVMNIKYDEAIERAISNLSFARTHTREDEKRPRRRKINSSASTQYRKSVPSSKEDELLLRLQDCKPTLNRKENEIFVVIDNGGEGLEPIVYLFGKSATDVCQAAVQIARGFS